MLLLWPPWNAVYETLPGSRYASNQKLEHYYKRHPYWRSGELDPSELAAKFPELYGEITGSPRIAFSRVAFELGILSVATVFAMLIAKSVRTI